MAVVSLVEHAEKWLVGAALANPDHYEQLKSLDPSCFNRSDLRLIFSTILAIGSTGKSPDLQMVAIRLNELGELEDAGGVDALLALANDAPYVAHVEEWREKVRRDHERRTLAHNTTEITRLASDATVTNEQLREKILASLSSTAALVEDGEYLRLDHLDRPPALPEWVFEAPGIIGEMVRYNVETAPRSQRELALFGAFTLVATVAGQKIRTASDIRPNIYVLAIAEASHGKDSPRKAASKALAEAGLTRYLAPEKPRSDKALIHVLAKQGTCLMQVDEIAHWLAAISSENASQWSRGLSSCLKELYSQSDRPHVAPFSAGDGKDDQILAYPHLNVYGTCQPLLWDSITMESVTDGLLARMLICQSTTDLPPLRWPAARPVGDPVVSLLKAWDEHTAGSGNLASVLPDAAAVYFDSQAESRIATHSQQIEERLRADETGVKIVWMRASVMVRKLAMIFAASRGPVGLVVTLEDADRAIACVNWSTRTLVYNIRSKVGGSICENASKGMLGVIRKYKRTTIRALFNNFSVRKMAVKDRHATLAGLHECGQVEISGNLNWLGTATNLVTYVHE